MKKNSLFLGVFFIFIGAFLLLNNLNLLNFSVWGAISDLWPLIFVVFGVHLISNKTSISLVTWIVFFAIIILYAIFKQHGDMIIQRNIFF